MIVTIWTKQIILKTCLTGEMYTYSGREEDAKADVSIFFDLLGEHPRSLGGGGAWSPLFNVRM